MGKSRVTLVAEMAIAMKKVIIIQEIMIIIREEILIIIQEIMIIIQEIPILIKEIPILIQEIPEEMIIITIQNLHIIDMVILQIENFLINMKRVIDRKENYFY